MCVRRGALPAPDEGEFYACDVEGRARRRREEGAPRELGRVTRAAGVPDVDVLVVAADRRRAPWEVPLVDAVVRSVDVDGSAARSTSATLEGVERG